MLNNYLFRLKCEGFFKFSVFMHQRTFLGLGFNVGIYIIYIYIYYIYKLYYYI